ncbi:MAG: retropepsin-like aspartic protease [Mastigocoleus sp. MO_167.B18]|uniref:retropepsin-like aspartic protease family protein n=1 Tax=Mastigocoleus sp. MO_188.B34 TaxID=3036635 RepID=UPI002637ED0C|nr:retropepsin-like aspartic protease [Mastigocoleus sp. MO_188.B34]MDJ0692932.1 retropepsin-like aspartic protease [Mastigocoleus sp. MO_188.B34]MDJ0774743.1 retropepsin-like aspartic protease [Mastigocoleus sp. MO_167.B18]
MLQSLLSRSGLIFLSATLTLLTVACSRESESLKTQNQQKLGQHQPSTQTSTPEINSQIESGLHPSQIKSNSVSDRNTELGLLEQALDKAANASNIGHTAQSRDDWRLVVTQYQDAIALLNQVRRQSINYTMAQIKIAEYQQQIQYAQKQARLMQSRDVVVSRSPTPMSGVAGFNIPQVISETKKKPSLTTSEESSFKEKISPEKIKSPTHINQQISSQPISSQQTSPSQKASLQPTPSESETQGKIFTQQQAQEKDQQKLDRDQEEVVFTVPIKRRVGGTPVIEVNFNGERQFDMIVDTGASGTVITQNMAKSLGVEAVGKAQANTASAKAVEFSIGYVDSMETAGVQVNQVAVAIAGKELEVGLLGHDFFGNYDLTIKRDVVELRPQFDSQFEPPIEAPIHSPEIITSPEIVTSPEIQPTVPTSSKEPQTAESL